MTDPLPTFLTDTATSIEARMVANFIAQFPGLDVTTGSFARDAIAMSAVELGRMADNLNEYLKRGFPMDADPDGIPDVYIDRRADEKGVERLAAVAATGVARFTGTPGTAIPTATTRITTAAPAGGIAQIFHTTADAVVAGGGTVDVPIVAEVAGSAGNVATNAIVALVQPIAGITGVTNPVPTGSTGYIVGTNTETNASLVARYLQAVRNPSTGGNAADYLNWSLQVSGIGGASVVGVRDGPGTASVAVIDSSKAPASQTLIDAVQNYIAPPWINTFEAENLTIGGGGTSIDSTRTDDVGNSVKMQYAAGTDGTIRHSRIDLLATAALVGTYGDTTSGKPGIWTVRPRIVSSSNVNSGSLLRIGVWDLSTVAWAKTTPTSGVDAVVVLNASQIGTVLMSYVQQFYWNGTDQLELRIDRINTGGGIDTTSTVWVDEVVYRSVFSTDDGRGKAPIGAKVTVEAAVPITINIQATLTIAAGFDATSVQNAVAAALTAYVQSAAFATDNDIHYARVGTTILNTQGVTNYTGLTVNGGVLDIAIGAQQVAVTGVITLL